MHCCVLVATHERSHYRSKCVHLLVLGHVVEIWVKQVSAERANTISPTWTGFAPPAEATKTRPEVPVRIQDKRKIVVSSL